MVRSYEKIERKFYLMQKHTSFIVHFIKWYIFAFLASFLFGLIVIGITMWVSGMTATDVAVFVQQFVEI